VLDNSSIDGKFPVSYRSQTMKKLQSYLILILATVLSVFMIMGLATLGLAILGVTFIACVSAYFYQVFTLRNKIKGKKEHMAFESLISNSL